MCVCVGMHEQGLCVCNKDKQSPCAEFCACVCAQFMTMCVLCVCLYLCVHACKSPCARVCVFTGLLHVCVCVCVCSLCAQDSSVCRHTWAGQRLLAQQSGQQG